MGNKPDRFDDVLAEFAVAIGEQAEDDFYERVDELPSNAGTPIERLMGAAFAFALRSNEWFGGEGWGDPDSLWPFPNVAPESALSLEPITPGAWIWFQAPIGKYKADFLLIVADHAGGYAVAAIECDGHDFHSATKEQASHDRERDREFQSRGLLILRYTGSDIWRSPLRCAADAIKITKDRARQPTARRWDK